MRLLPRRQKKKVEPFTTFIDNYKLHQKQEEPHVLNSSLNSSKNALKKNLNYEFFR